MTDPLTTQAPQPDHRSLWVQESLKQLRSGRDSLDHVISTSGERLPPSMLKRLMGLRDLNDVVDEFLSTYDYLYNDLLTVVRPRDDGSSEQAWRREAYRTAFSWFEGTIFLMKQNALKAAVVFDVALQGEEIAILSERQARLDERGRTNVQTWYPDTKANVRFAFRILAHCHGKTFDLDAGGQGWEDFKASYDVRNRLTHPKSRQSLEVSDDEIITLGRTFGWFADQVSQISKICGEAIDTLREQFTQSNQAMMQELIDNFTEPSKRIERVERVTRLLEALRAEVDSATGHERIAEAQAEMEALKQYFIGQLSTRNK